MTDNKDDGIELYEKDVAILTLLALLCGAIVGISTGVFFLLRWVCG